MKLHVNVNIKQLCILFHEHYDGLFRPLLQAAIAHVTRATMKHYVFHRNSSYSLLYFRYQAIIGALDFLRI